MRKKMLDVLFTFISFATVHVILGHFLFKEEINIMETLITSGVFCLIHFYVTPLFARNQKSKEDQKKESAVTEPTTVRTTEPWICYTCGTENGSRVAYCNQCGTSREWLAMKHQKEDQQ